jgi:hypothetical protein
MIHSISSTMRHIWLFVMDTVKNKKKKSERPDCLLGLDLSISCRVYSTKYVNYSSKLSASHHRFPLSLISRQSRIHLFSTHSKSPPRCGWTFLKSRNQLACSRFLVNHSRYTRGESSEMVDASYVHKRIFWRSSRGREKKFVGWRLENMVWRAVGGYETVTN